MERGNGNEIGFVVNYLPAGRVSSEVCKSVCEPIVYLVKCKLSVDGLNQGLRDEG